MEERYYDSKQAAKLVGVSRQTMSAYIQQGRVKSEPKPYPSGWIRHRIAHTELIRVFGSDWAEQPTENLD